MSAADQGCAAVPLPEIRYNQTPKLQSLSDFNEKNAFNIEKFLSTRMPMRPGERYRNYEVTAEDLASQTL